MHFLAMGGYALYVWPAFAATILVLAYLLVRAYYDYRVMIKEFRQKTDRRHASHS